MAIILIEEVLGGLDEVKGSLEQACITLTDVLDDLHPTVVPHLQEVLKRTLLQPLASHVTALEQILEGLARMVERAAPEEYTL